MEFNLIKSNLVEYEAEIISNRLLDVDTCKRNPNICKKFMHDLMVNISKPQNKPSKIYDPVLCKIKYNFINRKQRVDRFHTILLQCFHNLVIKNQYQIQELHLINSPEKSSNYKYKINVKFISLKDFQALEPLGSSSFQF